MTYVRQVCGTELARAHARSGVGIAISATSAERPLDRAMAEFAETYADQNERDYKTLTDAVKTGQIKTETGV